MPARGGKKEEKIKTHIAGTELYKYYKDKYFDVSEMYKISRSQYNQVHNAVWGLVIDAMINENYQPTLPAKMGSLAIRGYKTKVRIDENGKLINRLPVDWNATLDLWERDQEAKEKKILVRQLNKHTNGYIYRFYWIKHRSQLSKKEFWKFRITASNRKKLGKRLKDKRRSIDFYNLA